MTKKDKFLPGNWQSSGVTTMVTIIFMGFTLPRSQYLRLNTACCCMIGKLNEFWPEEVLGWSRD
jgi:hypothetical protein